MKTRGKLFKSRMPHVINNKELDKLDDVILFPEKVERAKKAIERLGLPKDIYKK